MFSCYVRRGPERIVVSQMAKTLSGPLTGEGSGTRSSDLALDLSRAAKQEQRRKKEYRGDQQDFPESGFAGRHGSSVGSSALTNGPIGITLRS